MDQTALATLVQKGKTIKELSDEFSVSKSTIRYWMTKFDLKTSRAESRISKNSTQKYITAKCQKHGDTTFIFEKSKQGYRCKKCRVSSVTTRRQNAKASLVAALGGKCFLCGYSKSVWAMHFHHIDPNTKEANISYLITIGNMTKAVIESKKCVLLCANCHAEEEHNKYKMQPVGLEPTTSSFSETHSTD